MRESGSRRYRAGTFVHLVWSTWQRLPMISPERKRVLYRSIASQAVRLGCRVMALGGTTDHVHLVVWFSPSVAISDLVKRAKGASAYCANHADPDGETFRWQGGYGAFTLSVTHLQKALRYVKHQEEHHCIGRLSDSLETTVS